MKTLALHVECLRELGALEPARARPLTPATAMGFLAGASLVGIALLGSYWLEQLVLGRLGGR